MIAVLITLIICGTLIALAKIGLEDMEGGEKNGVHKNSKRQISNKK